MKGFLSCLFENNQVFIVWYTPKRHKYTLFKPVKNLDLPSTYAVLIWFLISGIIFTPPPLNLLDIPLVKTCFTNFHKTCFTNVHLLQFDITPPLKKRLISGRHPNSLFLRPTIRDRRVAHMLKGFKPALTKSL